METTQKKVTFNKRVKRRFVERTPSTERANLWYRAFDYAENRVRESTIRNCMQHEDCSQIVDRLICEGIFTLEEMAMKSITVNNAISAVLDEQERQESKDQKDAKFLLNDDDEIAEEYRVHSRVSLAQAQNRARHLSKHMRDIESQPDQEVPPPPRTQGSPNQRKSPGRSPTLTKSKMSLVRRRTHYGRQMIRGGEASQMVKCTTPAA